MLLYIYLPKNSCVLKFFHRIFTEKENSEKNYIHTKRFVSFYFQPPFQKFMQLEKRKFYSVCVFIHGSAFEQIRTLSGRNSSAYTRIKSPFFLVRNLCLSETN